MVSVGPGNLYVTEAKRQVYGKAGIDYVACTNHTLPTMGAARYTGGLWVGTFLKTCTWQKIDPEGVEALAPAAEVMAQNEGLSAHALAARLRRARPGRLETEVDQVFNFLKIEGLQPNVAFLLMLLLNVKHALQEEPK